MPLCDRISLIAEPLPQSKHLRTFEGPPLGTTSLSNMFFMHLGHLINFGFEVYDVLSDAVEGLFFFDSVTG